MFAAKKFATVVSLAFAVLILITVCGTAQSQSLSLIGGAPAAHMAQERQQMAAEERQKKMLSDADQLVVMAQKLKVSVDKSNKDTLSLDVIREAERIEKLARQVRETMRQ